MRKGLPINMNTTRYVAYMAILVLALQLVSPVSLRLNSQQLTPPTISYEGQKVSSVEIVGRPDLNVRQLQQLIAQPVNAPYSQKKIDDTMPALKKNGQANDVKLELHPQSTGLKEKFVLQRSIY